MTRTTTIGQWDVGEGIDENLPDGLRPATLRLSPVIYRLSQVELIDTPGIDEVDGETRELLARRVAKQADLILFVVAGDITKVEYAALSQLREAGKTDVISV